MRLIPYLLAMSAQTNFIFLHLLKDDFESSFNIVCFIGQSAIPCFVCLAKNMAWPQ